MSASLVNVGDVLAEKYLVERVLGVGGMGVVVAARHMQLDEHVAIKFLLPEAAKSPVLVARFLREGRAAVKIRSEHVARVMDVGTLATGSPYIVMEYLEGSDLGALVKTEGPLAIEWAVDYILQACEAMAEAHVHGIIHRDLKPSNLFLTMRPDGTPCVKVIDFGISKIGERPPGEMEITGTLEARGSPLFMSPEQMVSTRDVDARSDIWSLGIALFHLLTGEYPFQAPTMPQICGLVLTAEPTRLSEVILDLPPGLDEALLGCLEKDPAQRYQNVGELAQALAPFGSAEANVSVERVMRILRGAGHQPVGAALRASNPAIDAGAAEGTPETLPMPGAAMHSSSAHAPVTEPMPGAAPGAPGTKRSPSGQRRGSSPSFTSSPSLPAFTSAPGAPSLASSASGASGVSGASGASGALGGSSASSAAESSGGAITAGPVVAPGEPESEGPPQPKIRQLLLATGIAALVLMIVTIAVVLLFLSTNQRGGQPTTASGPSSSPAVASSQAASTQAPSASSASVLAAQPPTTASGAPSSPSPSSPPSTSPTAITQPAGQTTNPGDTQTTPLGKPLSTSAPQPTATSKPTGTIARPRPTVDLFDTPK